MILSRSAVAGLWPDIILDDLGRELWQRGHRFVRYADDLRVFVRNERAAHRVFDSVCGVIERRLRLKVNREKSSIRHAADATLLGFGFSLNSPQAGIRVAPKAIKRLKDELRVLTRRSWGVPVEYRIGKINRFIIGSPGSPGCGMTLRQTPGGELSQHASMGVVLVVAAGQKLGQSGRAICAPPQPPILTC